MNDCGIAREAFLDTIVEHPAFGEALDAVRRAHSTRGPRVRGTIVYGDSGVGKPPSLMSTF